MTAFQLVKTYGAGHAPHARPIVKPIAGSVRVAVNGVERPSGGFVCDAATGRVTLSVAPPPGAVVTAGFSFDVPVRFDTDDLDIDLSAFPDMDGYANYAKQPYDHGLLLRPPLHRPPISWRRVAETAREIKGLRPPPRPH